MWRRSSSICRKQRGRSKPGLCVLAASQRLARNRTYGGPAVTSALDRGCAKRLEAVVASPADRLLDRPVRALDHRIGNLEADGLGGAQTFPPPEACRYGIGWPFHSHSSADGKVWATVGRSTCLELRANRNW